MITNEICAGGVVRRIDDLGRIVIPKDIRENANIKENDPFYIYCTTEGDIILRPYDTYKLDREKIQKANEALQTLNNKIDIIVFDKDNVIYASMRKTTAPIDNYKITQVMNKDTIDKIALESEILYLYPHGSLSIDQEKATAIVITNSMGKEVDKIIFNYLWKVIKG